MKRYGALATAFFVLMFSLSVCAASFSDMPSTDSEYYDALNYAISQGYLTGSDGKIMPNDNVTRAQAAAIFVRMAKLTDKANLSNVPDVISDAWYYDVMACAVQAGLFTAKDGKLYPDANLTRAEAFVLIYKAQLTSFAGEAASLEGVSDISSLSAEAKTALSVLVGTNVLTLSSGKAEPDKSITRAELALWIYNASKVKTTQSTETPSEEATEATTEAATESTYSQQAAEAMQLALGILSDGTSYITTSPIYRDGMTIIWNNGGSSGSSSSSSSGSSSSGGSSSGGSSSGGSSSGGSSSDSDDDSSSSTEAATSATEKETEPTETYTGTITNDNDNVVEDPFGDNDSSDDDEDDDFVIDDDDYFDYDKETESETETEAESEETPSETETEAESEEAPSDAETETEEETEEPSLESDTDEETDMTDAPTDTPEEESSEADESDDSEDEAESDEGSGEEDTTVAAFYRSQKRDLLIKRTDLA